VILGVVVLARKYEKNTLQKVRCKNSLRKTVKQSKRRGGGGAIVATLPHLSDNNNNRSTNCCFTRLTNDSLSSTTYFAPPPPPLPANMINMIMSTYVSQTPLQPPPLHHQTATSLISNEYEEGDYECSENSSEIYQAIKCCNINQPNTNNNNNSNTRRGHFMFKSCRRAASFDSYNECYNVGGHDLASVPVSHSIEKLTLNVYVYFNIASENDYVSNYLLPCLKKCLTLVPDTKYILRPQLAKFITSFTSPEDDEDDFDNDALLSGKKLLGNGTAWVIINDTPFPI